MSLNSAKPHLSLRSVTMGETSLSLRDGVGDTPYQATFPSRDEPLTIWGGKRGRGHWEKKCDLLVCKQRAIGINVDALDQQVKEHQVQRIAEKAEGVAIADMYKEFDKMRTTESQNELRLKYEADACLRDDWQYQAKSRKSRIEADINPKYMKTTPINPDRCGPGAAQNFAGEDRDAGERARIQKQQMKQWCEAEISKKQGLRQLSTSQSLQEAAMLRQIDDVRSSQEFEIRTEEQQSRYEVLQYNRLIAKEKRLEAQKEKLLQKRIDEWEVNNALSDPMLAEVNSRRTDHWKGMSPDEIAKVHAHNAIQVEENKLKKEEELDADRQWAEYNKSINDGLFKLDGIEAGEQRDRRYALGTQHKNEKREHRKNQHAQRFELGVNQIAPEFHERFGNKNCTGKVDCSYQSRTPHC